jgi:hypothetical protein
MTKFPLLASLFVSLAFLVSATGSAIAQAGQVGLAGIHP